jgi:hypothetical protein
MRESNERALITGIYARLREIRMSRADRETAIHALQQAELIVEAITWLKSRVAAIGGIFLKPSLRH